MSAIISRATWGARHRNGVGTRRVGSLEKYLHHTVTAHLSENATVAQERAQMRILEQIGQQRFGGGISYSFLIFPSGRIYEGASVNRVSYHSGSGRNTRGVGIALVGNFEANKLNAKAFNSIVWLLQEGKRKGWWGDPALTSYHMQFRSTACPGKHAIARFKDLNKAGRGGKVSTPSTSTAKPSSSSSASKSSTSQKSSGREWPGAKLLVDGKFHLITKRGYQRLLVPASVGNYKGRIDGDIGALTVKAEQRWLKRLGYYKGLIDGDRGPRTIRALQNFLSAKGFYRGYIDGKFQTLSIKGLQEYLNSQRKHYK